MSENKSDQEKQKRALTAKMSKWSIERKSAAIMIAALIAGLFIVMLGNNEMSSAVLRPLKPEAPDIDAIVDKINDSGEVEYDWDSDSDSTYDKYFILDEDEYKIASAYFDENDYDVKIYVDADQEDCDEVFKRICIGTIRACDPQLDSESAAEDVYEKALDSKAEEDGVTYKADDSGSYNYTFSLTVDDEN